MRKGVVRSRLVYSAWDGMAWHGRGGDGMR